jgi:hypothetical protein
MTATTSSSDWSQLLGGAGVEAAAAGAADSSGVDEVLLKFLVLTASISGIQ